MEFKRSTADLCEADLARRQNFEDIQLAIVWEATPDSDLPAAYVCVTRETDLGFRDPRLLGPGRQPLLCDNDAWNVEEKRFPEGDPLGRTLRNRVTL